MMRRMIDASITQNTSIEQSGWASIGQRRSVC